MSDYSHQLNLCWGDDFRGLFIHSRLGAGGMGETYLASHPFLQIPLVIKLFKTSGGAELLQEARLAARVTAPNVVGVIDAGLNNGVPFIIQRYVDGIDLAELIDWCDVIGWRLPLAKVCAIVMDAARGLHLIHQAGVVHRDVKPANLFLCGDGTAMIGDFGVAFATDSGLRSGEVAGTPAFIAPEQWLHQPTGTHTDIYALGATAHLLATGNAPFQAETLSALQQAHIEYTYAAPPARTPTEAYFFAVVAHALEKLPAARFINADEIARQLAVIATEPDCFTLHNAETASIGGVQVRLTCGDLTTTVADVLVNAANINLTMNLGVASALKRVGGAEIETEAQLYAPVAMGEVVWTGAGKLSAQWMAHAVAAFNGAMCLQRCTLRVLLGAESRKATTLAFPALGTGVGQVPMALAAKLMLEAIRTFATLNPRYVREVKIVLLTVQDFMHWREVLHSMVLQNTSESSSSNSASLGSCLGQDIVAYNATVKTLNSLSLSATDEGFSGRSTQATLIEPLIANEPQK